MQIFLLACFESLECFPGDSLTLLGQHLCLSILQQPNTMSITKKFNYKLVKSGNIILTATSDLKGYIVGQAIQLRTDIENKSGRDTGAVVASLLQVGVHGAILWLVLLLHPMEASVHLGQHGGQISNSVPLYLLGEKGPRTCLAYLCSVCHTTMGVPALNTPVRFVLVPI